MDNTDIGVSDNVISGDLVILVYLLNLNNPLGIVVHAVNLQTFSYLKSIFIGVQPAIITLPDKHA